MDSSQVADEISSVHTIDEGGGMPSWLLGVALIHARTGREAQARHILKEWELASSSQGAEDDSPAVRLVPCSTCGLPDSETQLTQCTRCRGLAHEYCSAFVRRAWEDGITLAVNPDVRPLCKGCLEHLQHQGYALIHDDPGLLLLQSADVPNDDF